MLLGQISIFYVCATRLRRKSSQRGGFEIWQAHDTTAPVFRLSTFSGWDASIAAILSVVYALSPQIWPGTH